jgi:NAD(P)-dependent dehydrogenase (short-subunit alcohol dehydrogenase family)
MQDEALALIVGCGNIAMAAARLAGRRAPLVVIDVDGDKLAETCARMEQEGYAISGFRTDISDPASVAAFAGYLTDRQLSLSAIAHVAAVSPSFPDWRRILEVNVGGPHLIAEKIGPFLQEGGAAVFVGSVTGHMWHVGEELAAVLAAPLAPDFLSRVEACAPQEMTSTWAYRYSKAALMPFAERVATDWGPKRTRALSVSLGLIKSEMGMRNRALNPKTGRWGPLTPLQREAEVEEAAAVIDFAMSPAASFMNGTDLLVDGGLRGAFRSWKIPEEER